MDKLLVFVGLLACLVVCTCYPRRPAQYMMKQPRLRQTMRRGPSVRTRLTIPANQKTDLRHHLSVKKVPVVDGHVNIIKQTVVVKSPKMNNGRGRTPPTNRRPSPRPTPQGGNRSFGGAAVPRPTGTSNGRYPNTATRGYRTGNGHNNRNNHPDLIPALKTLNKNLGGLINALSNNNQNNQNNRNPGSQHGAGAQGNTHNSGTGSSFPGSQRLGGSANVGHGPSVLDAHHQLGGSANVGHGPSILDAHHQLGGSANVGHGPSFLDAHHQLGVTPLAGQHQSFRTGLPADVLINAAIGNSLNNQLRGNGAHSGSGSGSIQTGGSLGGLAHRLLQSALFSSPTNRPSQKDIIILPNGPNTKAIRISTKVTHHFAQPASGNGSQGAAKSRKSNMTQTVASTTTPSGEDPPEAGEAGEAAGEP